MNVTDDVSLFEQYFLKVGNLIEYVFFDLLFEKIIFMDKIFHGLNGVNRLKQFADQFALTNFFRKETESCSPGKCFNTTNAGSNCRFVYNRQYANHAGIGNVGSSAQLDREFGVHRDYANSVPILF